MELFLELAVVVLPFGARGNRFSSIPVLHKLAVGYAEEIVKGGVDSIVKALTDTENKTPFCDQAMIFLVFYRDAVIGGGVG